MDARLIKGRSYLFGGKIEVDFLGTMGKKAYFTLKDYGLFAYQQFGMAETNSFQVIGNEIMATSKRPPLSLDVGNLAHFKNKDRENIIELKQSLEARATRR